MNVPEWTWWFKKKKKKSFGPKQSGWEESVSNKSSGRSGEGADWMRRSWSCGSGSKWHKNTLRHSDTHTHTNTHKHTQGSHMDIYQGERRVNLQKRRWESLSKPACVRTCVRVRVWQIANIHQQFAVGARRNEGGSEGRGCQQLKRRTGATVDTQRRMRWWRLQPRHSPRAV